MKKALCEFFVGFTLILLISCDNDSSDNIFRSKENTNSPENIRSVEVAFPSEKKELIQTESGIVLEKTESGRYILQGDIVLSDEQVKILSEPKRLKYAIANDFNKKWPDGIVYVSYHPDLLSVTHSAISEAIEHFESNTNLIFKPFRGDRPTANNPSASRIEFFYGDGNWSHIGRVGGKQQISIEKVNYNNAPSIIHEIGHAIGLEHEQCRPDRDKYITINYNNIKDDFKYAFDKSNLRLNVSNEFDFNSIMIYSSWAWAKNSDIPVMTKKDGSTWYSKGRLSPLDIKGIGTIYGNKSHFQVSVSSSFDYYGTVVGDGQYVPGSICTVKAIPEEGRRFEGWYEGYTLVSTSLSYSFIVDQSRTLEAKFRAHEYKNVYTIITHSEIGGRHPLVVGDVHGGGVYDYGAWCSLSVTIRPEFAETYHFVGWYVPDGPSVEYLSYNPVYSFYVGEDRVIYAAFARGAK